MLLCHWASPGDTRALNSLMFDVENLEVSPAALTYIGLIYIKMIYIGTVLSLQCAGSDTVRDSNCPNVNQPFILRKQKIILLRPTITPKRLPQIV